MNRKRVIAIGVVAAVAVGVGAWLLWPKAPPRLSGYVEGETLYFSAPVSGAVTALSVERGQRVNAGQALFQIDAGTAQAQTDQAQAAAQAAQARAEDALKGQRPQELAVIGAQRAAAGAQLAQAKVAFERVRTLQAKGVYAQAALDEARATYQVAQAQYRQTEKQLDVAELGARTDQARAAADAATQARAAVSEANVRQGQLAPSAPAAGRIEDVFYRRGEWAPANQPVVALLPDERVRVRFFVGETDLPAYKPGRQVRFDCDGCKGPLIAAITYVSPRAEFTPPVIYSRGNRERMVFLVEATPQRPAELAPGQPVDVIPLRP
jgi:HlyD family secretion protein